MPWPLIMGNIDFTQFVFFFSSNSSVNLGTVLTVVKPCSNVITYRKTQRKFSKGYIVMAVMRTPPRGVTFSSYTLGHPSAHSTDLIAPEVLEPLRGKLRVPHGVLNILVPHVCLDGPGIVPLRGKVVAGCMTKQMGMNREVEPGKLSGLRDHLPRRPRCHRPFPLRGKNIRRFQVLPEQSAQRSNLRSSQGMDRRRTIFQPVNVQQTDQPTMIGPPVS